MFSINNALKNGFKFLQQCCFNLVTLCFDCIIPTANDFVTGVKMNTIRPETACNAMVNATINKAFDINQLYKVYGHCCFEMLRSTPKIQNLTMFGNEEVCEDCDIAKAKQKSINKVCLGSSNIPGDWIHSDISLIKERRLGGAKFGELVVDDYPITVGATFLRILMKDDLYVKCFEAKF
jgi:hypothetical protein